MGQSFTGLGPKVRWRARRRSSRRWSADGSANGSAFGSPVRAWARLCSPPQALTCVDGRW